MKEKAWHYGCLFCRTGAEATIAGYINRMMPEIESVAPIRIRRKTVDGKIVEDQVQLLPGYIFFRTEMDEQPSQLTHITHVLKLLEYDNHSWKLTGSDSEFAEFLFDNDLLQPPHVTFIGGKLHFEDGFLYGYDDAVIRVNRRKKTAEVRLGIDRLAFWIGYDETVCLLSNLQSKEHIESEMKMGELDLIAAEKKAIYPEIKDYVLEHSGLKVSSLYIA